MNPSRLMSAAAVLLATLLVPIHASADLVTFKFEGVTSLFEDLVGLGWTIPNGTVVTGTFTFDSATPDSNPDDPTRANYYDSIVVSSSIQIGNQSTIDTGLDSFVAVTNGFLGDDLYQMIDESLSFRGIPVSSGIVLSDHDAAVFDNVSIPTYPPPLDEFEGRLFTLLADDSSFSAAGTVASLALVPEPGTLLLLVGAGMLVGWRGRRFGDCA
ncbi:MAG: PEP-CTERM sorting domain-containing protein [Phycisphaerales bacterium]|nr:PEP-CTERM sorting domain-containing protein [Phycisphaerales bacterium]